MIYVPTLRGDIYIRPPCSPVYPSETLVMKLEYWRYLCPMDTYIGSYKFRHIFQKSQSISTTMLSQDIRCIVNVKVVE